MCKQNCTIYGNCKIFTSNKEQPFANTMVVTNGRITWIGDEKELQTKDGNYVDMKGRLVLPGIIDAHMHPLFLADTAHQIACTSPLVNSIDDMITEIRKRREEQGPGKWIEGWDFDEGKLKEGRTPNRWDLDKGASDAPVIVVRSCVHVAVVNSKALEIAGIDRNTPDPPEGKIERDSNGEPTGVLKESAKFLFIKKYLPAKSLEETTVSIVNLSSLLLSHGITSTVECLGLRKPTDYYEMYTKAYEKGFKQRLVIYYANTELDMDTLFDKEKLSHKNHIYIGGIKVLSDGSVSGRTAWVNPPYIGDDNSYGLSTINSKQLLEIAEIAKRNKIQIVIHAMGQQAIDLIIDTFYDVPGWLEDEPSIRIEHFAMPTERAIRRAAEMGSKIGFTTQPIFQYAEIESYLKNLGLKRTQEAYPVRTILKAGLKLAFSSDAPATTWADPSNPFVAMKAAVTRRAYDGTDCGQDQKVDISTAVELYTREAQKITGIPEVGQLKTGFHADFIVLDKDIFNISAENIDTVNVEETYMDGELVYKK